MNSQNILLDVTVSEYHKFPVKKNEILRFSSSGQVLSPNGYGSESTQYKWRFEKGFRAFATGFENSQ